MSGQTPTAMSWSIARNWSTRTPCFSRIPTLRSTRPCVLLTSGDRLSVQFTNSADRSPNPVTLRLPRSPHGDHQGARSSLAGPAPTSTSRRAPLITRRGERSVPEHLRDEERQLEGLLGVQPRVAGGLVAAREVGVGDVLGAAEALGDVLAGELHVDPAGVGAQALVDLEEALHLVDDLVEVPRLVAGGGLDGVAVHRVALPDDLVAGRRDLLDDARQDVADLPGAHPGDQREPSRLVVGVEALDVLDRLLRRGRG